MRAATRLVLVVALAALALASGCRRGRQLSEPPRLGGTAPPMRDHEEPRPDWPRAMVVAPGEGPVLYLGPTPQEPAIGYLEPGVRVRVESAPVNGRVEVLVAGAMPATGWVPASRLGAHVTEARVVEGTPAYLAVNDVVSLHRPEAEDHFAVVLRPRLRDDVFLGPFQTTLPRAALSERPSPLADAVAGCRRLAHGDAVALYDAVGGTQTATLPALDPPLEVEVLSQREGWTEILAGQGPHVRGFVRASLSPCVAEAPGPPTDALPVWMRRERGALYRVAAGTRVTFNGRVVARLREPGWARALGNAGGPVIDVFVAVDDQAAIRGLVQRGTLSPAGRMTSEALEGALSAPRAAAQRCVAGLRASGSAPDGVVELSLVIEASGEVSDARVTASPGGGEALEACVVEAYRGATLSPTPEVGPVSVLESLVFRAPPVAPTPAEPEAPAPAGD